MPNLLGFIALLLMLSSRFFVVPSSVLARAKPEASGAVRADSEYGWKEYRRPISDGLVKRIKNGKTKLSKVAKKLGRPHMIDRQAFDDADVIVFRASELDLDEHGMVLVDKRILELKVVDGIVVEHHYHKGSADVYRWAVTERAEMIPYRVPTSSGVPVLESGSELHQQVLSMDEKIMLAIAVETFRKAFGRWPETVEDLREKTTGELDVERLKEVRLLKIDDRSLTIEIPETQFKVRVTVSVDPSSVSEDEKRGYADPNFRIETAATKHLLHKRSDLKFKFYAK